MPPAKDLSARRRHAKSHGWSHNPC